jgi:cytoskeletal protein CcmA (bactofilin family)
MGIGDKKKQDDIIAFLGKGTAFDGKLILSGSIRIDGNFKGEISGAGTLIIGETAKVEADIAVDTLLIYGAVRGNFEIKEKVEICSTGKLFGNLKTPAFIVQEGATFDGDCRMGKDPAVVTPKSDTMEPKK